MSKVCDPKKNLQDHVSCANNGIKPTGSKTK